MKKKAACLCLLSALLFFTFSGFATPCAASALSAGEAVIEAESGRLLYALNEQVVLPMASTTKIMTALLILEDCDLDEIVTVPEAAAGVEGSSIYLQAGEKISVRDLLYGLMLRSGNDCAVALALHHSKNLQKFCVCMNEKAKSLGCAHTHFCNPHGLPAEGHATTAHDLAVIAAYALKNEQFSEIVSTRSHVIPDGGCGYARSLQNKNKMLYTYEGADGVKTGYTKEAGRCLVSSATREGMRLVSVVLNSPDMYLRSAEILDSCFSLFKRHKLFDKNKYFVDVKTEVEEKNCRCKCCEDFYYPLKEEEIGEVRIEEVLPRAAKLPIREGDEVGILKIYLKNQLLFSQKIVSIEKKEKSLLDILREMGKRNCLQCVSTNFSLNAASPAAVPATN